MVTYPSFQDLGQCGVQCKKSHALTEDVRNSYEASHFPPGEKQRETCFGLRLGRVLVRLVLFGGASWALPLFKNFLGKQNEEIFISDLLLPLS